MHMRGAEMAMEEKLGGKNRRGWAGEYIKQVTDTKQYKQMTTDN